MEFIQAHWALFATILWAISEILAAIPNIKANSVFQLVYGLVKQLVTPSLPPKQ